VHVELRLVEEITVSPQRLPRTCQSGIHGAVQSRPHHVHLRTPPGDEEVGAGRKGIQGIYLFIYLFILIKSYMSTQKNAKKNLKNKRTADNWTTTHTTTQ